jgi:hypothetical protein
LESGISQERDQMRFGRKPKIGLEFRGHHTQFTASGRWMCACCDAKSAPGDLWEPTSLLDDYRRPVGYFRGQSMVLVPKAEKY